MGTKRDINFEYYSDGQYFKRCAFKPCNKLFPGPLNKLYCCDKCRERQKTINRKLISFAANGDDLKIRKALRILKILFVPNREGYCIINKMILAEYGFPFNLPTNKVKFDWFDGEMSTIGLFSYYIQGNNYIFYRHQKI
jgi:hypothetical protein